MTNTTKQPIFHRLAAPLSAAMLLTLAGIAPAALQDAAPELKTTTETVSVQNITVKDGENLVEVRVIDGEVFIKVNGEQRPTRSLSGDWAKIPITVEGREKPIATIIRDGENDRVVVMAGSPKAAEIAEFRASMKLSEEELVEQEISRLEKDDARWTIDLEGLEGLEEIQGIEILERLGREVFSPAMKELRIELESELGPEAMREIELLMGEAGADWPGLATFRLDGQPKSMIGITMSVEATPDGEVIVIEDTMEGMPAAKAGLRSGDRIIRIESLGEATQENIRKVTREFEPGQQVKLRVLRDGEEIEKTIELAPYRSNVFGLIEQPGDAPSAQSFFTFERDARELAELNAMTERLRSQVAEQRAAIEKLAQEMVGSSNPEETAAKIQAAAKKLEDSVRKLSEQSVRQRVQSEMIEQLRAEDGGGVIVGRGLEGERPRVFTLPGAPTPPTPPAAPGLRAEGDTVTIRPDAQTQSRIESLEQRLDRLEDSNERIEEMLQALMRQIAERG